MTAWTAAGTEAATAPAAIPDPGCLVNPVCMAQQAANSAIESAFAWLSEKIGQAIMATLKFLTSSWINVPTPDVETGALESITANLAWIAGVLGAVSLMVAVAKMALTGEVRHGAGGMKMLLSYSVTSAGAITITATAIAATDQLAVWILGLVPDGVSPEKFSAMFAPGLLKPTAGASMFLMLLMGFLMICALLAQVLLMVLRNAALPLLLMGLPFTAATSSSPDGDARFKKNIGWLISFIAYKPVAAAIYALGLSFIGSPTKAEGSAGFELFNGFAVILLATIALPALLKLMSPAPGSGTSGAFSGGAIAAGVVASGAAVVGLGAALASGGGPAAAGASTAASGASGAGGGGLAPALHGASVGTNVAPPPDGDDLIPQGADAS